MTNRAITSDGDLFYDSLIRSYVDKDENPRFIERDWLWLRVQAALHKPGKRFVMLTGEPGAGKTAFMAWIASTHPSWPRYFIRRDQHTSLEDGGSRGLLEKIGYQLAACFPDAFRSEAVQVSISQLVGSSTGEVIGAEVKRLIASPFYAQAIDIIQEVADNRGKATGIQVREMVTDSNLISILDLQRMALLAPAQVLQQQGYAEPIVVLIDALDELRYHTSGDTVLDWLTNCVGLPENIRVLVTCRPDRQWLDAFRTRQAELLVEEIIPDSGKEIESDLNHYASYLASIPAVWSSLKTHMLADQEDMDVRNGFVTGAVEKARGNLGYLDALGRAIDQAAATSDEDLLRAVLEFKQLPDSLQDLYGHFLVILRRSVGDLNVVIEDPATHEQGLVKAWENVYRPVLGVLAVAREAIAPEQVRSLGGILAELDNVIEAIGRLRQFLDEQGGRYSFYHATLPEFLVAGTTHTNLRYQEIAVDSIKYHQRIAKYYWRYRDNWEKCDLYGFMHLASHAYFAGNDRDENPYQLLYRLVDSGYFPAKINKLMSPVPVDADFKLIFQACQRENQLGKLARFVAERIVLIKSATQVEIIGIPGMLLSKADAERKKTLITRLLGESSLVGDALRRAQVLRNLFKEAKAAGIMDARIESLPQEIWQEIKKAPRGDSRSYQAIQLLRSMSSHSNYDESLIASILAEFQDLDIDYYKSHIAAARIYAERGEYQACKTMLELALSANYVEDPGEFLQISSLLDVSNRTRLLELVKAFSDDLFSREWPTDKVSDQQNASIAAITIGLLAQVGEEKQANILLDKSIARYRNPREDFQEWVRELCLSNFAPTIPFFLDRDQASLAWEQLNRALGTLRR